MGPVTWGVPGSELVFLGVLVVLVCGLLFVLSSLAFRKTYHRGLVSLGLQFYPLGTNCVLWETWLRQKSWGYKSWIRRVQCPSGAGRLVIWLPCKLAWWRLLSLSGYDACLVIGPSRAPGGRVGQKKHKTPNSPLALFLVSMHSLRWYWGCLAWHLWIGRARHSGPGYKLGVEVFNISGWLTNGDFALETEVDFLAVVEHRLVPARARSECRRLRDKGISSVWSPASQDFSPVGNAGVGVLSLQGAPFSLPTFATSEFEKFFGLGRVLRCVLPLGLGRFMHLVYLYGYHGADSDAECLKLTGQLFEAVLGELAVVARGQPCLIVGDFNTEPRRIPYLAKGIASGLWVDIEASWASASGREPEIPVNAHGTLTLEIGGIFRLDAHCALLLLCHVVSLMIGGYSLILL